MPKIQVNDNGVIRTLKKVQTNDNGIIRNLKKVQVNDGGVIRTIFQSGTPLGDKNIGDIVKITIDNVVWEFIVGHKGQPSAIYDTSYVGGVILLMKDLYTSKRWGPANQNNYEDNEIDVWLNDAFYNLISTNIRSQIIEVKIPYRPGVGVGTTVNNRENGLPRNVFLLGHREVGSGNSYTPTDGAYLSFFSSILNINASTRRIAYLNGIANRWWLRTPYNYQNENWGWLVDTDGSLKAGQLVVTCGIRPAFVLPDTLLVDGGGVILA